MRTLARLPLALRFALRDLIGDPRGFGVFIACIVIGVAAISGVSGLSQSLAQGLAREGRTMLGGDVSFTLNHRMLNEAERSFMEKRGRPSQIGLLRAMVRRDDGETALIEVKSVDPANYPAFGKVEIAPALPIAEALKMQGGVAGLVADPMLIARLELKPGDHVNIGDARFELRGTLRSEPDRLAGGVGFGARVLISEDALRATGLVQPGSIVRYLARVALPEGASDADVTRFGDEVGAAFPHAGWEMRKRDAASPQFTRNLERFAQLLTLVALTALVAGGAGVANAVHGLIDRKRAGFAILKAVGASSTRVFAIALAQVLLVAAIAIALGLAIGAALPFAAAASLSQLAELPIVAMLDPAGLAIGALYGLLVTLVFALGPLGRAHNVSVAALLRDDAEAAAVTLAPRYRIAAIVAMIALVATVLLSSPDKKLAASYISATAVAFLLLRVVAAGVVAAARRLPRAASPQLRLAQANIHRPRNLTAALILSVGLTQTLLVALALVEGAIHTELARGDTGKIPSFYFIDAPKDRAADFAALLAEQAPGGKIDHVPLMRGRIVAVKGARSETLHVADDAKWALEGDRGVTFSAAPPTGSQVAAGEWWPADYKGEPLVSLEAKVAAGLGLAVGDTITVNVLGREISARVANFRRVDWRNYAINFVMVFSPNAFAGAPYSELFTLAYDAPDAEARDAKIAREVARRFPTIASVRVKDALVAIDKIAGQLAMAARYASGVAIVTAMLALASAVASGQRARLYDAVVLKTLGATRRWLAGAYALEFAALGVIASLIAVVAGSAAAFVMVEGLMKIDFVFQPVTVAATVLVALALTIGLGLAGTWRTLSKRPGPELRNL